MRPRTTTTVLAAAAVSLLALPASAGAYQYFNGLMGPGGICNDPNAATTHYSAQIDGAYTSGRSYRSGMLQAGTFVGSFYATTLPVNYSNAGGVSSSKGQAQRYNSGTGYSTVQCYVA